MKVKIRRSTLKKKRLSGFLVRRKTRSGRNILARQRRRRK